MTQPRPGRVSGTPKGPETRLAEPLVEDRRLCSRGHNPAASVSCACQRWGQRRHTGPGLSSAVSSLPNTQKEHAGRKRRAMQQGEGSLPRSPRVPLPSLFLLTHVTPRQARSSCLPRWPRPPRAEGQRPILGGELSRWRQGSEWPGHVTSTGMSRACVSSCEDLAYTRTREGGPFRAMSTAVSPAGRPVLQQS